MSIERLKEINEKNAASQKAESQFQAILKSDADTRSTILSATSSLIRYLEGHTSKTELVNQLEEIGTPDVLKVVAAVNSLHDTLKTHENTDLTELMQLMHSLVDEAKKIPKELPEQKEFVQIDYKAQFESLTKAVKAVETVVKEQELIAEAPIVNLPETVVNVDAPDLTPIQKGLTDVVEAVGSIVIPEYKTDNKELEKLTKRTNKLLEDILDKPVGSGGGGGGRVSPYQDSDGIPQFVELVDGKVPVTGMGKLVTESFDYIAAAYPTSTTETYTYKSGGSSGTTVATVTVTYTSSSKELIASVGKT